MMAMTTSNSTSVIALRLSFMLLTTAFWKSSESSDYSADHSKHSGRWFGHVGKLHCRRRIAQRIHGVENPAKCGVLVNHEVTWIRCRQPALTAPQLHTKQIHAIGSDTKGICSIAQQSKTERCVNLRHFGAIVRRHGRQIQTIKRTAVRSCGKVLRRTRYTRIRSAERLQLRRSAIDIRRSVPPLQTIRKRQRKNASGFKKLRATIRQVVPIRKAGSRRKCRHPQDRIDGTVRS